MSQTERVALLLVATLISGCLQKQDAHPNILIVVTDDQGWGDFGINGNDVVETPTIDALASQGAVFDRFYVSPVCSSTRASLLTGRHFLRTGVWSVTRGGEKFRASEVTIAEHFADAGYRTGLFGKWHNGAQYPHRPRDQGFQEFFGFLGGHLTRYFDADLNHNGNLTPTSGFVADAYTQAAVDFILAADQRPFLAVVAFNTPHSPFELEQQEFSHFKDKGLSDIDAAIYGLTKNIDTNLKTVLDALRDSNLEKETIVVFLSDNGPAFPGGNRRFNGPWKGNKGKVTEGGIRVPLIVRWPGHIEADTRVAALAQHIDILPTLASLSGVELRDGAKIDGVNLTGALTGTGDSNRMLFSSHFHNTQREDQQAIRPWPSAVHFQDWAAVREAGTRWSLYHLGEDPEQRDDLAAKHPELVSRLSVAYDSYFEEVTAEGFATLPAVIGEPGTTVLPAHEGAIRGDAFDYAHRAGWAEDWIVATGLPDGSISWRLRADRSLRAEIRISYGAIESAAALELAIDTKQASLVLEQHTPTDITGRRVYDTGEAPDRVWKQSSSVLIELAKGDYELTLQEPRASVLIKSAEVRVLGNDSN